MLTLAAGLLVNVSDAEDAVHDTFVAFAGSTDRIGVDGDLKSYLSTCVVNRARDMRRTALRRDTIGLHQIEPPEGADRRPEGLAIADEQSRQLHLALVKLHYLKMYKAFRFSQILVKKYHLLPS